MNHKTPNFPKPDTLTNEQDMYGLNVLSDGDRMGEIIPSLYAWMPPEAMKEHTMYHEEVTQQLAKKGNRKTKRSDLPPYSSIQSDQNSNSHLQAKSSKRAGKNNKSTDNLLAQFEAGLIEPEQGKGPRRPSG